MKTLKTARRTVKNRKQRKIKHHHSGGFFLTKEAMDIFGKGASYYDFINYIFANSTRKLISYSSLYGIIIRLDLNPQAKKYVIDVDGIPITRFLVKFSFISKREKEIKGTVDARKMTLTEREFTDEFRVQRDIFKKSVRVFGRPIVPDVQLGEVIIYDLRSVRTSNTLMSDVKKDNDIINGYIDEALSRGITKCGMMMMKFADGYQTYGKYFEDAVATVKDGNYEAVYKYKEVLDRVYRKFHVLLGFLGYVHGDAHAYNIMIKDENDALIIDFGRYMKTGITFDANWDKNVIKVVDTIGNNCDIWRRSKGRMKKDWPCTDLGQWDDLHPTSQKYYTLMDDLINYLSMRTTINQRLIKTARYRLKLPTTTGKKTTMKTKTTKKRSSRQVPMSIGSTFKK